MPAQTDFTTVFENLKSILKPYAKKLTVRLTATPTHESAIYGRRSKLA